MFAHWLLNTSGGFVFLLLLGCIVSLAVYVLPILLAWSLGSSYFFGIALLDGLFGWTVIGWIAALVWAMASGRDMPFDEDTADGVSKDRRSRSTF
jgi:hypothetical protein